MVPLYIAFSRLLKGFVLFFRTDISQCATSQRQCATSQRQEEEATSQPVNSANSILVEKTSTIQTKDSSLSPNKRLSEKVTTGQVISARDLMTDSELSRINNNIYTNYKKGALYKKGVLTKFVKNPQNNFGIAAEKIVNHREVSMVNEAYKNIFKLTTKTLVAINKNDTKALDNEIIRFEKLIQARIEVALSSKVVVNKAQSSAATQTSYADKAEPSEAVNAAGQAEPSEAVNALTDYVKSSNAQISCVVDQAEASKAVNAQTANATTPPINKKRLPIEISYRRDIENTEADVETNNAPPRRLNKKRLPIKTQANSQADVTNQAGSSEAAQTSYANQAESSKDAARRDKAQTRYANQAESNRDAARRANAQTSYTDADFGKYVEESVNVILTDKRLYDDWLPKTQRECDRKLHNFIHKAFLEMFSFQKKEMTEKDFKALNYTEDVVWQGVRRRQFKGQYDLFEPFKKRYANELREHYEQFMLDPIAIAKHEQMLEEAYENFPMLLRSKRNETRAQAEARIKEMQKKVKREAEKLKTKSTQKPASPILLTDLPTNKSQTSNAKQAESSKDANVPTSNADQAKPNSTSSRTLKRKAQRHRKADKDNSSLTNQANQHNQAESADQAQPANQANKSNKGTQATKGNKDNQHNKAEYADQANKSASAYSVSHNMIQDASPNLKNRGGFYESDSHGYNALYLLALVAFLLFLNAFFYRPGSHPTQKRLKTTKI